MSENTEETIVEQNQGANDFLLSEFNALQERSIGLENIKSSRVIFFLIVFGATVAGSSALADVQSIKDKFPFIGLISAMVLFLLGISTLKNVTDYSIAIVTLLRRAGRVRRWFVDNNPEIVRYVAFQANDDKPSIFLGKSLLSWRGGEPILVISNVVTASLFIGVSLSFVSLTWSLIGAALSVVTIWQFQILYLKRKLLKHQLKEEYRVNFPSSKKVTENE